jgi:hypothetical protein
MRPASRRRHRRPRSCATNSCGCARASRPSATGTTAPGPMRPAGRASTTSTTTWRTSAAAISSRRSRRRRFCRSTAGASGPRPGWATRRASSCGVAAKATSRIRSAASTPRPPSSAASSPTMTKARRWASRRSATRGASIARSRRWCEWIPTPAASGSTTRCSPSRRSTGASAAPRSRRNSAVRAPAAKSSRITIATSRPRSSRCSRRRCWSSAACWSAATARATWCWPAGSRSTAWPTDACCARPRSTTCT